MEKLRRLGELGRGAHGVCHRAVDDSSGDEFCLKTLCVNSAAAAAELAVLRALPPHPHVVSLLGSSHTDAHLLMQLELMSGSLDRLLEQRPLSGEPEAWGLLAQAAAGLAHVHANSMLHRDVKLENLLYRERAGLPLEVKIADFGVARVCEPSDGALTFVGTAYNLSPEMIEGFPYGPASDAWALGCSLFELLARRKPFMAPNLGAVVARIVRGAPALPAGLSPPMASLLRSLLALDAAARPTMAEVLALPHVAAALAAVHAGRLPAEVGGSGGGGGPPSSRGSGGSTSPPTSVRLAGAIDVWDGDSDCEGWGSPVPSAGARDGFFGGLAADALSSPPPPTALLLAAPSALQQRRSANDVLRGRAGEPAAALRKRRSANDVLSRGMEAQFLAAMARARAGWAAPATAPAGAAAPAAVPSLPPGIAARLRRVRK
jgi:serine/threonine protein kinase